MAELGAGQGEILNRYFDLGMLTAVKARRDLKTFVKTAWHILHPKQAYIDTWHMDVICDHLQALYKCDIRKLLITIPPGCAKSMLAAVFFPCWVWLQDPTTCLLYLSFGHTLSDRDSGRCRTVMRSPWYKKYFGHIFTLTKQGGLILKNDMEGQRIATSVEGKAAMGERGDILVVDDALSINDGQTSEAKRKRVNIVYDGGFSSRARDSATLRKLVIQQRIHQEDLVGHLLEQGGWELLCLPAEFVPERRCVTSIGRDPRTKDGELLFPQLFSAEHQAEERKKPGYSALYQQSPVPEGGGIIKTAWITDHQYSEAPRDIIKRASRVIQSWDTAQKTGDRTSFTVGQVWAVIDARFYLIDQIRERLEFVDIIRAIDRLTKLWPQCQEKLVEDRSSGSDVISMLRDKIPGIIPVPVNTDGKEDRLRAVSWVFEAGNVRIPKAKVEGRYPHIITWVPGYIEELPAAPVARYLDQTDSTSQALARLVKVAGGFHAVPIGVGSTNNNWQSADAGSGWGQIA